MFMVSEAERLHVVEDSPEQDGPRRSKRHRTKPMKFWKNERFVYHTTKVGIGAVMPVPFSEVRRSDSEEDVEKPKRKRARTRGRQQDLQDLVSDLSRSVEGNLVTTDPKGREVDEMIGCTEGMLSYETVSPDDIKSPGLDEESSVRAAKFFDTPFFTNGLMVIPPSSKKEPESIPTAEVFFIRSCPSEGLLVRINDESFKFGTGDSFWIPPSSEYTIENLSGLRPAQLFFLVCPDAPQGTKQHRRKKSTHK
jgi:mannose-6-phosphate isomerase-like protein (cupin superfamily)